MDESWSEEEKKSRVDETLVLMEKEVVYWIIFDKSETNIITGHSAEYRYV